MTTTRIEAHTVAEAFLAMLADRGADYLFANAGTDFPPIIEALSALAAGGRKAPVPITVPHENLAVAMAHGHTMISGRPQAVMVHVNVGTANAICGVLNAARIGMPMLLAAGRTPLTEAGLPGSRNRYIHWAQEMFDQAGMLREAVKWDYELRRPEQVETVLDRAFDIATAEPKGPVYLTLPREVLAEPHPGLERRERAGPAVVAPHPDPRALAAAARLLARAERPLVITADLGRNPAAVEVLAVLAERFALPVVSFMARYVCLPSDHPMHVGAMPGPLLAEADLVLVVDCDVPWIASTGEPSAAAKIVHLGIDPLFQRYPIRGFAADLAISGDAEAGLRALDEELRRRQGEMSAAIESRRRRIAELRRDLADGAARRLESAAGEVPLNYAWVSHCIDQVKDDDTIVVNELALAAEHVNFAKPGTFFAPSPAGGLGWGLGAALGAKLAAPDRLVIAAVGDGSYMFGNPTPAHFVSQANQLPILFVVFNNAGWSAVLKATQDMYPKGHAMRSNQPPLTRLSPSPGFERVVEASGGYGERVDRPEALRPALERALKVVREEKRQALLNVICRPR